MDNIEKFQIDSAKLQVQTQIMHQNIAIILQQLCYIKSSLIVLVLDEFLTGDVRASNLASANWNLRKIIKIKRVDAAVLYFLVAHTWRRYKSGLHFNAQ